MASSMHPVVAEVHPDGGGVPRHRAVPRQLEQSVVSVDPRVRERLSSSPDYSGNR